MSRETKIGIVAFILLFFMGAAGKGEASAASQSPECQASPMTQKSKFRNAGFILIAR